jgi:hypothetical protein
MVWGLDFYMFILKRQHLGFYEKVLLPLEPKLLVIHEKICEELQTV